MGKRIVLLILLGFLTSCAVLKKEKSTSSKETEKTEIKKDSSSSVKTNKAINDEVSTQVSSSGDAELDKKVDQILSSLNTTKKSGDNSYKFSYDKELRQLKAEFKVAQTKDSIASTNNSSKIEKTFDQQIEEYVKKITIPWWMYVLGIIILWRFISPVLFPIYTTVKSFVSSRILNPPK